MMGAGAGVEHHPEGVTPADAYIARMIAEREGAVGCARCGGCHEHLTWKRFERPVEVVPTVRFKAWATCPETGDPVLFQVIEIPGDDP